MAAVAKDVEQKVARAPSKTKEAKPKAPKLVKVAAPAFKDQDSKVIAGLPAPDACPFCKRTDCTIWTKGDEDSDPAHFVRCEYCGGEGPFARSQLEAANFWNSAATADPAKNFDGLIDNIAPAPVVNRTAAKIVESSIAHRHSFDSLSMRARAVVLRGLKSVLDNSKSDEEFEEATALSALLIDDLEDAANAVLKPKRKQFIDIDDSAPIEGLPEPAPCPFCGFHEWTGIVTNPAVDANDIATYHVQCDGCFAEGSPKASKLEAAEHWNKASKVDYSIVEAVDSINLLLYHLSDVLVLSIDQLREHGVDIDQPIAACLEAALDAKLEPAREQVEKLVPKLRAPKVPSNPPRLALTG